MEKLKKIVQKEKLNRNLQNPVTLKNADKSALITENFFNSQVFKNPTKNQDINTGWTWDNVSVTARYIDTNVNFTNGTAVILSNVRYLFKSDLFFFIGNDMYSFTYCYKSGDNINYAMLSANTSQKKLNVVSNGLVGNKRVVGWLYYWKG